MQWIFSYLICHICCPERSWEKTEIILTTLAKQPAVLERWETNTCRIKPDYDPIITAVLSNVTAKHVE